MATYYIRSTGEIVGPNEGAPRNKNNKQRKAFGNLFTTKRQAERAAKLIKIALRVNGWLR